jgi:hypothetical protein
MIDPDFLGFLSFSRILLNVGGNDITEFLYILLERTGFPYRDLDLARSYDWDVMEDLKSRTTTLHEVCGFFVRSYSASRTLCESGGFLSIGRRENNGAFIFVCRTTWL